jgi:predicted membrane protein
MTIFIVLAIVSFIIFATIEVTAYDCQFLENSLYVKLWESYRVVRREEVYRIQKRYSCFKYAFFKEGDIKKEVYETDDLQEALNKCEELKQKAFKDYEVVS